MAKDIPDVFGCKIGIVFKGEDAQFINIGEELRLLESDVFVFAKNIWERRCTI